MKSPVAGIAIGFLLALAAVVVGTKWLGARPMPHVITVTGESRLVGQPDTAMVMFGIEKSANTVAEGQKLVSAVVNKVIAAVQAAGAAKQDVATSALNVSQGWDYHKHVPKGYNVSTMLTVTVRDVQAVGRVIDVAVASGLNRLQGVRYDVRTPAWRQKALREALVNAHEKAQAMATDVGPTAGTGGVGHRGRRMGSVAG